MEDVANVISTATVDAPKGSINGPTRSMTIYDNDQLLKAAPWNDVVVAYKNGGAVRIRDIGVAVDGPENRLINAWQNGRNGILLLIFKQPGANVIDAVKRVQALLPHALASVPPSIKVDTVANRTTTIKASVRGRGNHPGDHHRAGGAGDISVPAQLPGPPSSRASPCRWRCSAPSR